MPDDRAGKRIEKTKMDYERRNDGDCQRLFLAKRWFNRYCKQQQQQQPRQRQMLRNGLADRVIVSAPF